MTISTGNDRVVAPAVGDDTALDNEKALPPGGAIPDLIYPDLVWREEDYSSLQVRLDMYEDHTWLKKFSGGQVRQKFIISPTETAAALAGLNLNSGFLPRQTLFWSKLEGQDRLGIYIPPKLWLVVARDGAAGPEPHRARDERLTAGPDGRPDEEGQAWRVPLPGLILVGHGYDYSLWAVTERPTDQNAPLYMAPCPNVHPEGVCRGNAPFPKAHAATIWQAVDVFFSSRFKRDLSDHKSVAYPDCVLDQWRALHEAGAESYPLGDMVRANLTLGRLIDV